MKYCYILFLTNVLFVLPYQTKKYDIYLLFVGLKDDPEIIIKKTQIQNPRDYTETSAFASHMLHI